MDLAGYVINAVLVEGQRVEEVCAAHDLSRSWLYELIARYRRLGEEGPQGAVEAAAVVADENAGRARGRDRGAAQVVGRGRPGRRRPYDPVPSPGPAGAGSGGRAVSGHDLAGPVPPRFRHPPAPQMAPQLLAAGPSPAAPRVLAGRHPPPPPGASPPRAPPKTGPLSPAESRHGRCAMENELAALGIIYKHSRPYHPQTCGKVERFHQTLKKYLARQPPAPTLAQLQAQLDHFARYYNHQRPHRAIGRRAPIQAFSARTKATPRGPAPTLEGHHRVRRDRLDKTGCVTLRYRSKLRHIGIGRAHAGTRVLLLVADHNVRIITQDGELLRQLTIDPTKDYQTRGRP